MQNELFGRARSPRAQADGDRGRIVQANGGMLFLDDVGDLPLGLQSQLLHVIEEREVMPHGCDAPIKVDVRLVCAIRGSLQEKVRRERVPRRTGSTGCRGWYYPCPRCVSGRIRPPSSVTSLPRKLRQLRPSR